MTKIKVFHTRNTEEVNPFQFSGVQMLSTMGVALPSKSDLKRYYVEVLSLEVTDLEVEPKQLCENIFHQINAGIGCFQHMVSQSYIAKMGTHTSTSVGDIIQVNDIFYYVDYIGFEPFKMEELNYSNP